MMESQAAVEKRYRDALDSLVTKVQKDRNIIAAILCGSMSYDQVWDKSDIDLLLVQREGKGDPQRLHSLRKRCQHPCGSRSKRSIKTVAGSSPARFVRSLLLLP